MKICFVDKTKSEYSFKDINSYEIRGAESILINFSKELSKMGHEVVVFNNCKDEYISCQIQTFAFKNIRSLCIVEYRICVLRATFIVLNSQKKTLTHKQDL